MSLSLCGTASARDWTEHECEVGIQGDTYVRTYIPPKVLLAQGTHPTQNTRARRLETWVAVASCFNDLIVKSN